MSSFEVNLSKLRKHSSDINEVNKILNSLKQQIEKCNRNLSSCLSYNSYANIKKSLLSTSNDLQKQIVHLKSLSLGLSNVANTYSNTESQIKSTRISFMNKNEMFKKSILELINGGSINGRIIPSLFAGSSFALGNLASGKISGGLFEYDVNGNAKVKWKKNEDGSWEDASAEIEGSASFHGAKGSVEVNVGALSGSASASLLNASVNGAIGASLFKDGKLAPSVSAELKGKVNVAEGEVKAQYGDKYNNAHIKASGEVLGASAEASGSAGVITYKNSNGETVKAIGVQGKVGAEAYAAQGSISGGVSILGVKIDVSATGKAGGAGASASGQVTSNGASGSIGAGLGLGGGLAVAVDWSGAVENGKEHWNEISSAASKGWNSIKDGVSKSESW